jgi:MFS family permease
MGVELSIAVQAVQALSHDGTRMPWRTLALLLAGQLMASMDASILTVAMPALQRELDATPTMLQAIFAGYTFAFGVLVVTGARLGDDRGHGRMFVAGLAGFTATSLLCGLAPSATVLLAGRLLQGACAALMTPQTLQVIQLRFSGPARERAVGLYAMVLALGVCAGQVVGGVIVTALDWRWALLINVPIGVVLLVLAPRVLPPDERRGARLDLPGVAVLTGAMALILVPLLLAREQGWPGWVWPCLAAGVAGVALFGRIERARSAPLLDPAVLREPGMSAGLATVVAVMGAYAALLFSLTLHLQDDLGFTPLRAGLAFAAYAVGFAAMSLGWRRLPAARWLPVGGPLALGGGAVAIAALAGRSWPLVVEPVLFVAGAGHAAGYGPVAARTVARVRAQHAPEASALLATGSVLASSFAIATLGSLYLSAGLTAVAIGIAATCAIAALSATTSP